LINSRGEWLLKQRRIEDIVIELAAPLSERLQLELVDVEYRKEGPHWVLRCLIDAEAGIGVADCQRFSEALGRILDDADPIPGSYLLEVSSPGLERPLKKTTDFIRFAEKQVTLKLHKAINERKQLQGELAGMDEALRLVRLRLADQQIVEVPLVEIAKANLSAEFFGETERSKRKK
jgi:ribosome maturation factor RimP